MKLSLNNSNVSIKIKSIIKNMFYQQQQNTQNAKKIACIQQRSKLWYNLHD